MRIVIDAMSMDAAQAVRELIEKHGPEAGLRIEYSKLLLRITEADAPAQGWDDRA